MLKIEPHLASDLNQERYLNRFKIILGSTVKSINGYFGTNVKNKKHKCRKEKKS